MTDIKSIINDPENLSERVTKVNILKNKIDKIIQDWVLGFGWYFVRTQLYRFNGVWMCCIFFGRVK